jgi:hypothetical protein
MQQPDLIIDFSDVLKLICVYPIILLILSGAKRIIRVVSAHLRVSLFIHTQKVDFK